MIRLFRSTNFKQMVADRFVFISLVLLLAIFSLGAVAGAGYLSNRYMHKAKPDNPMSIRGCVVRFDTLSKTGRTVVPRIHIGANHYCVGVTSVYADWSQGYNRGSLVVKNTNGAQGFVTLVVDEDETLTKKGINCGGSGGGVTTVIRCYDRNGKFVPAWSKQLHGAGSNLWLMWVTWEGQ